MKLHIIAAALLIAGCVVAQTAGPIEQQAPAAATEAVRQGQALPEVAQAVTDASGELLYWHREAKCAEIVRHFYPKSGFGPHVEHFIRAHEKAGLGAEWQWSAAYSGANFSMRCNIRARNGCAGPMDRPGGSTDPADNIDAHVAEMKHYYRTKGESGYQLMRRVFYPARPHDWGGKRIWRAYEKHRKYLEHTAVDPYGVDR